MKNNIKIIILLLSTLVFAFLAFSCSNGQNNNTTITLNKSQIEIDIYDTYQLNATVTPENADIIWLSSNNDVAEVDSNGLIKAKKVGNAEIIAKSNNCDAKCAVKVFDSNTTPVLKLNTNNINIAKDDSFTILVDTLWKNVVLDEAIQYSCTFSDGADQSIAQITPANNGKSIVVSGNKIGETDFVISATVRGKYISRNVHVKVCSIDVTFKIENLTAGKNCYSANLGLVEAGSYKTEIVPQIKVYRNGKLSNEPITLTSLDSAIVKVENDKIIALKEGQTQIIVQCSDSESIIKVNVVRPEIILTDRIDFDILGSQNTFTIADIQGTITSVELEGVNIYKSFNNGQIEIDKDLLPTETSKMGGGKTLKINTEKVIYSCDNVGIFTKVLRTKEDINNFGEYSKSQNPSPKYWGGYFVLGNDIAYNDKFTPFISYETLKDYPDENNEIFNGWNCGFTGIFDGRGYNIEGLEIVGSQGAFIGVLNTTGVIKNVSFTKSKVSPYSSLICIAGNGTVENVYVDCMAQVADGSRSGILFGNEVKSQVKIKQCFIKTNIIGDGAYAYGIGNIPENSGMLEDVYCIGTKQGINNVNLNLSKNIYGAYENYNELVASGVEFTSWDTDFWALYNGVPYPKNLGEPHKESSFEFPQGNKVAYGESLQIKIGITTLVVLDASAVNDGITLTDNKIVIPNKESLCGKTYTLGIKSVFDTNEVSNSYSFKVIKEGVFDKGVITAYQIDMDKDADKFNLDLSKLDNVITGDISDIIVSKLKLSVNEYSLNNNILSINKSVIGQETGNVDFSIRFKDGENYLTYKFKVPVFSMIIRNESDLNRFLTVSNTKYNKGGYFVLGNDIVCTGKYVALEKEFLGVFDGKGYSIYNFESAYENGGLFTVIGNNAVYEAGIVKNVSFINAKNSANSGLITRQCGGLIENVFISLDMNATNSYSAVIFTDLWWSAQVRNVMVEYKSYTSDNVDSGYLFWRLSKDCYTVKDVYAIGIDKFNTVTLDGAGTIGEKFGTFSDYNSFKNEVKSFEDWLGDFWTIINGVPMPKSVIDSVSAINISVKESVVSSGTKVDVISEGVYLVIDIDENSKSKGVTIRNNTIIIPDNAYGFVITVTAISLIDSSIKDTVTISVIKKIQLSNVAELNLNTNESFVEIDVTDIKNEFDSINSATLNGKNINIRYENSKIVIPISDIKDYGEREIVLYANKNGINAIITIPVYIYKGISTKEELLATKEVNGVYKITNDIDFGGATITAINPDNKFSGIIDGDGHTVSNFTLVSDPNAWEGYSSLFAIGENGEIKNLILSGVTLNQFNGGIFDSWLKGKVSNVVVDVTIASRYSNNPNAPIGIIGGAVQGAVIENVIVFVTDHSLADNTNVGIFTGNSDWGATFNNCIAVNVNTAKKSIAFSTASGGTIANPVDDSTGIVKTNCSTFNGLIDFNAYWAEHGAEYSDNINDAVENYCK